MATSSFENFVNTELPYRIATLGNAPAGTIPVFTGLGLITEATTTEGLGIGAANRYAGEWDLSVAGPGVEAVPDPTKSTNSTFRLVSDDFEYDGDSSPLIFGGSDYYDYVVADGVSPSTAVSELRSMRFDMPITNSEVVVPGIVNTAGTVPDLLNALLGASSTSSGLLLLLQNGVDSAIDGANIEVYPINAGVLDEGNAISLNIASPVAGEPIFFSLDTLTGSYTITIGGDANRITVGGTPVVGHSYTALVGIDMANFDGTVATDTFSPFYALVTNNPPDLTSPLFSSLVFDLGTTLGGRLPFLSRGPTLAPLDVTDGKVYKVVGDGTYLDTKLANNDYVEFTDNLQKLIVTRLASSESALVSGSYGDENTYSAITVDDYNRVTEVVEFQLQKPTTDIPNSTDSFPLETKTLYVIGKWNLSTYGELNLQLPPLTPTSIIEIFISGGVSELGKVNLIPNGADKIGFSNATVDIGYLLLPGCTATLYYDSSFGGTWSARVAYNKNVPTSFKFHPSDSNSPYNFGAGHTVTTQATESRTLTIPNANVNLGSYITEVSYDPSTSGNLVFNTMGGATTLVGMAQVRRYTELAVGVAPTQSPVNTLFQLNGDTTVAVNIGPGKSWEFFTDVDCTLTLTSNGLGSLRDEEGNTLQSPFSSYDITMAAYDIIKVTEFAIVTNSTSYHLLEYVTNRTFTKSGALGLVSTQGTVGGKYKTTFVHSAGTAFSKNTTITVPNNDVDLGFVGPATKVYTSGVAYVVGELVYHQEHTWRVLVAHTGAIPFVNGNLELVGDVFQVSTNNTYTAVQLGAPLSTSVSVYKLLDLTLTGNSSHSVDISNAPSRIVIRNETSQFQSTNVSISLTGDGSFITFLDDSEVPVGSQSGATKSYTITLAYGAELHIAHGPEHAVFYFKNQNIIGRFKINDVTSTAVGDVNDGWTFNGSATAARTITLPDADVNLSALAGLHQSAGLKTVTKQLSTTFEANAAGEQYLTTTGNPMSWGLNDDPLQTIPLPDDSNSGRPVLVNVKLIGYSLGYPAEGTLIMERRIIFGRGTENGNTTYGGAPIVEDVSTFAFGQFAGAVFNCGAGDNSNTLQGQRVLLMTVALPSHDTSTKVVVVRAIAETVYAEDSIPASWL